MKQYFLILIIIVAGFTACKDKKQTTGKDVVEQKTDEAPQDRAKDSTEIRTVITDFYNWYNKNYTKFQDYHLYSGIKKKDAPPYKINWDEVEKYQDFIRSSVPQLGEEFLKNQKIMFTKSDSAFKVDVNDDIPYYFDYDWYTNSQEDPQYLLDEINKSKNWVIVAKDGKATVDIKALNDTQPATTVINLAMTKENNQWKIAKIGND